MIRLKEIEKEHPEWVTSDSPSQKIGGTVKREAGVKVTHNVENGTDLFGNVHGLIRFMPCILTAHFQ